MQQSIVRCFIILPVSNSLHHIAHKVPPPNKSRGGGGGEEALHV